MRIPQLLRRLAQPILWWGYRRYNSKGHWHHIAGLRLYTGPSVFHPRWFLTTQTLTNFALEHIQPNSRVLELGAGNGLLALSCARAGAEVMATDINPVAVESIKRSATVNQLKVQAVESDLFTAIPNKDFDFIFINPPYFPGEPRNAQESAFLCGKDFSYFKRFFSQWQSTASQSNTYIILTDACQIDVIKAIANRNQCEIRKVFQKSSWGEEHLIYQVSMI